MPAGNIPNRKPRNKTVGMRALTHAFDGAERPYPVYRFGARQVFERPNHNPFFTPEVAVPLEWNPSTVLLYDAISNSVRNQADDVSATLHGLFDASDATYFQAFPDMDGWALAFTVLNPVGATVAADLDIFTQPGTLEDKVYTSVRVTARVEAIGTLVDDPLRLNVSLQAVNRDDVSPTINLMPFHFDTGDKDSDDFISATIFQHANQVGIQEVTRTWSADEAPSLATFTDWSGVDTVLAATVYWQSATEAAHDDGTNIRIYSLDIELIE